MTRPRRTLLENALLGLLLDAPRSGYALRRLFAATPIGRFSASPGAIYPALRRLEAARLVATAADTRHPARPARICRLTAAGRRQVVRWLSAPVTRDDAARRADELILRFAFLGAAPEVDAAAFLDQYAAAMGAESASVRAWLAGEGAAYPLVGRLALEHGVAMYDARRTWAVRAAAEIRARRKETR